MASRAALTLTGLFTFTWSHQVHVAHTERRSQFVEGYDGRIPPAALQAADVLLAETGNLGELLLGQAVLLPDSLHIPPDQFAHVHAPRSADYTL